MAGLERVPIIVREKSSDRDLLEVALVENLQREDLNPLEAAEAYARLREEFQLTQEKIAERVGKDRATVANTLRLLKLPASVREKIRSGALSAGHARALVALSSADDQERLAEEILRRALSVRQTEKRVARLACGDSVVDASAAATRSRATPRRSSRGACRPGSGSCAAAAAGGSRSAFGSEEELIGSTSGLAGK